MIDLAPEHLRLTKEILRRHVPDREIWAFGSRITGKAKPHSDLDLVVLGIEKLASKTLAALKDDFASSDLPMRVDLVDWNRLSEEFRKVIEQAHEKMNLD